MRFGDTVISHQTYKFLTDWLSENQKTVLVKYSSDTINEASNAGLFDEVNQCITTKGKVLTYLLNVAYSGALYELEFIYDCKGKFDRSHKFRLIWHMSRIDMLVKTNVITWNEVSDVLSIPKELMSEYNVDSSDVCNQNTLRL